MLKKGILLLLCITLAVAIVGCANIPQESVTLNKEVATGITSIHESNIRFVNQYFDIKKAQIDRYESQAVDDFFNKIATAMKRPGAPPLAAKDLYKLKEKVEEIHAIGNKYRKELDDSKALVTEKLQGEYNLLIAANNSITALLQSAVDMEKAKNDGLSKTRELAGAKIDLMDIDTKINGYLAKIGDASTTATSLSQYIQRSLLGKGGE